MKELSRTEMATVKRTAANVKTFRAKKAKLEGKIAELTAELVTIDKSIELFEAPIVEVTGGFTSEQILNGDMDAALQQLKEEEPVVETTTIEEVVTTEEVPTIAGGFPLFGEAINSPLPFEA